MLFLTKTHLFFLLIIVSEYDDGRSNWLASRCLYAAISETKRAERKCSNENRKEWRKDCSFVLPSCCFNTSSFCSLSMWASEWHRSTHQCQYSDNDYWSKETEIRRGEEKEVMCERYTLAVFIRSFVSLFGDISLYFSSFLVVFTRGCLSCCFSLSSLLTQ